MRYWILATVIIVGFNNTSQSAEPVEIGSRLELFVDDHLVESTEGDIQQVVQNPEPKEVVYVHDQVWGGNICAYYTVFQDGETYRMYFRSAQYTKDKPSDPSWAFAVCAVSEDGVHWTDPNLGMVTWRGSDENNILRFEDGFKGNAYHNFTVFRDNNPATLPEARYKGVGGLGHGLLGYQSPDAIHWEKVQEKPIITNGKFDSQNLVFWDSDRNEYRAYWRYSPDGKLRLIRTATSPDFLTWENEHNVTFTEGLEQNNLYTSAVQKYFRAPHLFIAFPTKFFPETEQVEPIFMSSRDGVQFHPLTGAVIPRSAPKDRDLNRSNYMAWGMVQLPGQPNEISVYGTENYFQSTPSRVRRFVFRLDGFVALHGGEAGGQLLTKPLQYTGKKLLLNSVVPEGGTLEVEVLDQSGSVVGVSNPIVGDSIDAAVSWKQDPQLSEGIVQLRFNITNADVFSFRFN
ncbi:hypothetical protein Pla110_02020 [Polystyrenella longa]|uniref:Glycosyl hydrolase family 32 N-terminal domain-containing protein n=1 Tax=Polystyrenella longa TaxID=2528007 RepID=A0A518CGZ6_9PLAN|nr:hypothetical protein [Polystyrenella longa]QDU78498.1 hypothetical protein Pla110_02020 [Polystyrenella longa]